MPEEFSRTTKRKRVRLPSGDDVDVPVITKVSFIDPFEQYQEYQFEIINNAASDRNVHVVEVHSTEGSPGSINVERIDDWKVTDVFERAQETHVIMDNVTGEDSTPPHFITHLRTHVVKYKSQGDSNVSITSELINEFTVVDPFQQYQEKHYILRNPENDDDAQANPDDPEVSDTDNGVDPPWRTDPFQNIIDFKATEQHIRVRWIFSATFTVFNLPPPDQAPVTIVSVSPFVVAGYTSAITWALDSFTDGPPGFVTSGGPPVVSNKTFSDWIYLSPRFDDTHSEFKTGASVSFALLAGNIDNSLGVGYYGPVLLAPFGIHGGGTYSGNDQEATAETITVTTAGLSAMYDTVPWEWIATEVTAYPLHHPNGSSNLPMRVEVVAVFREVTT